MKLSLVIGILCAVCIAATSWWYVQGRTLATISEMETRATSAASTTLQQQPTLEVYIDSPISNATSSFQVLGRARGFWFFEAQLHVEVRTSTGTLLWKGLGAAQSDWMTTDFVPFTALVNVGAYTGPAQLVVRNENPSGIPANDKSIAFPVLIQ
jgi:Immunoglobulin-like domain of bacterial spore germination